MKRKLVSYILVATFLASISIPADIAHAEIPDDLGFDEFVNQISVLKNTYDSGKDFITEIIINPDTEEISYEEIISDGVVSSEGDEILINVDELEGVVGSGDLGLPNTDTISIDEFVDETSFEATETESGEIVLGKIYQTCRVIIKASEYIEDSEADIVVGPYNNLYVYQYKTEEQTKAALERFETMSGVEFAQTDMVSRVSEVDADFSYSNNDTWGYNAVGFRYAQEYVYEIYGANVENVVVAVLDTGLDINHPLFDGRVADIGYDFANNDEDVYDDHMHGTAVAGVIVSSTPEYVKVLPVKVGDSEGTTTSLSSYAGIEYAIRNNANVINMSYTGYFYDEVEYEAIKEASNAGIIMVAAYGNDTKKTDIAYPACFKEVVAVSSIDSALNISSFSNYGNEVDLCAPGTYIYTTYPTYMGDGSGYTYLDGTSFSSPYTAAAFAMVIAMNPNRSSNEIKQLVFSNAKDLGSAGWDIYYGYGMVSFENYKNDTYVATIGNAKYSSFISAFEAAKDGDTITLVSNVNINNTIQINKNISIVSAKSQALCRAEGFDGYMFSVENGKTLTIGYLDDSEARIGIVGWNSQMSNNAAIYIAEEAKCVLGNNVYISDSKSKSLAGAIVNKGTLDVYAATLKNSYSDDNGVAIYADVNSKTNIMGELSVDDGTLFLSDNSVVNVKTDLPIDKRIAIIDVPDNRYTENEILVIYENRDSISRKHFGVKKENYKTKVYENKLIVSGYAVEGVAKIGSTFFSSLEAAINAASDGDVIVIIDDIEISKTLEINKSLTLLAEDEVWITRCHDFIGDMIVINSGIVNIGSAEVENSNIKISGESIYSDGSAIAVGSEGTVNIYGCYLGGAYGNAEGFSAIRNSGNLLIEDTVIENNKNLISGGALYNEGIAEIFNTTICSNESGSYGGAIFNTTQGELYILYAELLNNVTLCYGGAIANSGKIIIDDGKLSCNKCTSPAGIPLGYCGSGGAIWNAGQLIINGGEITHNEVNINGGGIVNAFLNEDTQGYIEINGGRIAYNLANCDYSSTHWGHGGGISNDGMLLLTGGVIEENSVGASGGGVANAGVFRMTGGCIQNNYIFNSMYFDDITRSGTEIYNGLGYESAEDLVQLLGGILRSDNREPYLCMVENEKGATLEVGGDFEVGIDTVFCLVDGAIITVTDNFRKKEVPIELYIYSVNGENKSGEICVKFNDEVDVDDSMFREHCSYKLIKEGNTLVLSDDTINVSAEGNWGPVAKWKLENHILTLSGEGEIYPHPDISYYKAGPYLPWYKYKAAIYEVVITDEIDIIYDTYLLGDLPNLKKVYISEGVSIGPECFNGSNSLDTIYCESDTLFEYTRLDGSGGTWAKKEVFKNTSSTLLETTVISHNDYLEDYDWETDNRILKHYIYIKEYKEPTTETEGNIKHYYCSKCNKYYSDVNELEEISKESVFIPKVTSDYSASVSGYSLTISDSDMLGLNVFVNVPTDCSAEGVILSYSVGNNDVHEQLLEEGKTDETELVVFDGKEILCNKYKLVLPVDSKQMADIISIVIRDVDGKAIETEKVTVDDYAHKLLKWYEEEDWNDYYFEYHLVSSMLRYGAACQLYFSYNDRNLAGKEYYNELISDYYSIPNLEDYCVIDNIHLDDIEYCGTSLIVDSGIIMRHYFRIDDINSITINGYAFEKYSNNLYYVDIDVIWEEACKSYDLLIKNGAEQDVFTYSVLNYAYLVKNNNNDSSLLVLMNQLVSFSSWYKTYLENS